MFLLDDSGYIIGFNSEKEDKPAPFAIKGTRWNGKEWEYPPIKTELVAERNENLPLEEDVLCDAYELQMLFNGSVYPCGGKYVKEKSDKVSVLIPSYNKAEWVKEAVESALNQTVKPFRIIVLAMTDADYEAVKDLQDSIVKVKKNERLNASVARNYLVKTCPTEYFIFLDADDTLQNDFIEKVLEEEESIVFVENDLTKQEHEGCSRFRFEAVIGNLTAILCKEAWNDVGGLREDLCSGGEDSYFVNELFRLEKWKIGYCARTWYNYRQVDDNSLTGNTDAFILSKEKEIYLHKEWYEKLLNESWATDWQILLDALYDFCQKYENKDKDSTELIKATVHKPLAVNVIQNKINEHWNTHKNLFEESRIRETSFICTDESKAELYGRKFDLYIYSNPCFNFELSDNVDSCYINNPEIDINEPLENLLKKYCVIFDCEQIYATELPFMGESGNVFSDALYDFKNVNKKKKLLQSSKKNTQSTKIITLVFFMKCNKQCPYCSQKGSDFSKDLDEETLLKNFYEMVDKIESVYGRHWLPQICGGEPTLMSENLAKKVMERLEGYRVTLVTNGNEYGKHIFYSYPNLDAYVHLTEKPYNDSFMRKYDCSNIVVTKEDLPDVLEAIKNHSVMKDCFFAIYAGTDPRFVMSEKDIKTLDKALKENDYPNYGIRTKPNVKLCSSYDRQYMEARIWNRTFVPCCGKGEEEIPIGDWHGQEPSGKHCKGCAMYLWY